jgi:acyl carrier protein
MHQSVFESLQSFISEEAGIDENRITPNTRLYDDLNIYGDDAMELIMKYGKKFNVNLTKFMAADYFEGEGGPKFIDGIFRFFTGGVESNGLKVLTVYHLEKGIHAGRLDEEVINQ